MDNIFDKIEAIEKGFDGTSKSVRETIKALNELQDSLEVGTKDWEEANKVLGEYRDLNTKIVAKQKELQNSTNAATKSVKEYTSSLDKVGSVASSSFNTLTHSISESNPELATSLDVVRKIVPSLTEVGKAAQKTGSLMKAAFSSTGILLALNAIVTVVSKIIEKHREAAKAAQEHALAEAQAAAAAKDDWESYIKTLDQALDTRGSEQKLIDQNLAKIADLEKKIAEQEWVDKTRRALSASEKQDIEDNKTKIAQLKEYNARLQEVIDSRKKDTTSLKEEHKELDDIAKLLEKYSATERYKSDLAELTAEATRLRDAYASGSITEEQYTEASNNLSIAFQNLHDSMKSITDDESLDDLFSTDILESFIDISDVLDKAQADAVASLEHLRDRTKSLNDDIKESFLELGDSVSNMWQETLDAQLRTGKISEQEYEERSKAMRNFQAATIVANSAASIADVWRSYAGELKLNVEYGNPIAKAAADAKSTLAAVARTASITATMQAQLAALKSGTMSSATAPTVTPTPATVGLTSTSITSIGDATGTSVASQEPTYQPVLVVDDLSAVQGQVQRVQLQSEL